MARQLTCFIIGPMGESEGIGSRARLTRLKNNIVRPVLETITAGTTDSYEVKSPFDLGLEGGNAIIRDVIYNIDRADIVVADLTNANPNVFYELGITHALGRPCVAVLQEGQPIQFDVNAYRVFRINLDISDAGSADDAYAHGQTALTPALKAAHSATDDWSRLENPVIDYYHAPMTYVSPASALADGYFSNFVRPVVTSLTQRRGNDYFFDVSVGADLATAEPGDEDRLEALSAHQRTGLDLEIVVPARIELAKHDYADDLRAMARPASVETSGRALTLWAYPRSDGQLCLVDIPTTMRGVEPAVDRRMRFRGTDHDSEEWRAVEKQEVDRFVLALRTNLKTRFDSDRFRRRVTVTRSDQIERTDDLAWIRSVLPAG
ncbi:STING domain-containing protein [Pedococcus sp. 5OH_020]|uniref:STING domain-containing protein n=1 Tax=Pedococcus sp. 5OH_020 TaxID=2989814 RepID=UPI0022E9C42A|nr:STING domain-containing protein [Pedococcus sp. 5OH_020]